MSNSFCLSPLGYLVTRSDRIILLLIPSSSSISPSLFLQSHTSKGRREYDEKVEKNVRVHFKAGEPHIPIIFNPRPHEASPTWDKMTTYPLRPVNMDRNTRTRHALSPSIKKHKPDFPLLSAFSYSQPIILSRIYKVPLYGWMNERMEKRLAVSDCVCVF